MLYHSSRRSPIETAKSYGNSGHCPNFFTRRCWVSADLYWVTCGSSWHDTNSADGGTSMWPFHERKPSEIDQTCRKKWLGVEICILSKYWGDTMTTKTTFQLRNSFVSYKNEWESFAVHDSNPEASMSWIGIILRNINWLMNTFEQVPQQSAQHTASSKFYTLLI